MKRLIPILYITMLCLVIVAFVMTLLLTQQIRDQREIIVRQNEAIGQQNEIIIQQEAVMQMIDKGDLNSDGSISITDFTLLRLKAVEVRDHILGKRRLSDEEMGEVVTNGD